MVTHRLVCCRVSLRMEGQSKPQTDTHAARTVVHTAFKLSAGRTLQNCSSEVVVEAERADWSDCCAPGGRDPGGQQGCSSQPDKVDCTGEGTESSM